MKSSTEAMTRRRPMGSCPMLMSKHMPVGMCNLSSLLNNAMSGNTEARSLLVRSFLSALNFLVPIRTNVSSAQTRILAEMVHGGSHLGGVSENCATIVVFARLSCEFSFSLDLHFCLQASSLHGNATRQHRNTSSHPELCHFLRCGCQNPSPLLTNTIVSETAQTDFAMTDN